MTQAIKNGAYVNPGIGIPALCAQFQPADLAIPGAFRVSQFGDLANWRLGVKGVPAVGGAMDLILTKDGKPKLVEQCTFPLTGATLHVQGAVADLVVPEFD